MLALILSLGLQAGEPAASAEALARGDDHYAHRDEGASGAQADPARIERALAEYRRALSLDPDSIEARCRLLRAIFFRATFCGAGEDEQRRLFDEARRIADEGIGRLEKSRRRPSDQAQVAAWKEVRNAAHLYFWAAVSWGEWAQRRSRL